MRKRSIDTIISHMPGHLRAPLMRAQAFFESDAREIILRADRPITVECGDRRYYLTDNGALTTVFHMNDLLRSSREDVRSVFKSICDYSVYARQNELIRGYITIANGVRVGVCGTAVRDENGVRNIKDITTLSFRVSTEIIGCAEEVLRIAEPLEGILICGPPCSGKTTMIRDMARILSARCKVCILDERNEISATVCGKNGFDIGMSDVLVNQAKDDGAAFAIRSLAPDIIVCDELGDERDAESLRGAMRCGAAFIATVHARDREDLHMRRMTADLLATGAFRRIVFLSDRRHAGRISEVYEWRGKHEADLVYDCHRRVAGGRDLSLAQAQ